jgi:hypothetical protein
MGNNMVNGIPSRKMQCSNYYKEKNTIKFNYPLHGHSLEHVTSAKYLGCTITSDLKWGPHINNICNKANSTYRQLPQEKLNFIGFLFFVMVRTLHFSGWNAINHDVSHFSSLSRSD